MQADKELDTSGLNCPLPILKAKKALAELNSGQLLKVIATDPSSSGSRPLRQTGHELVAQESQGDKLVHWLRRR
jgi:TusA-related sulfurtransferase